ncbi:MAG: hypothetical protein QXG22_02175 [Candidatus Hadarchaeales archaeon]
MGMKGVADLLAIASMFFLLLTASSILYLSLSSFGLSPHRYMELKAEQLYRTLESSEVVPGVGYLRAVAEILLLDDPTVPENELPLSEVLEFLCPENLGAFLEMRTENAFKRVEVGRGERVLATRRGALTLATTGGLVMVRVEVGLLGP